MTTVRLSGPAWLLRAKRRKLGLPASGPVNHPLYHGDDLCQTRRERYARSFRPKRRRWERCRGGGSGTVGLMLFRRTEYCAHRAMALGWTGQPGCQVRTVCSGAVGQICLVCLGGGVRVSRHGLLAQRMVATVTVVVVVICGCCRLVPSHLISFPSSLVLCFFPHSST